MSDNINIEVYKLLLGIIGTFIVFVGGVLLKFMNGLKKTDGKIFNRINKMDKKITEIDTRCKERAHKE